MKKYFLLLCLIFLISCSERNKSVNSDIKSFIGSEVIMTDTVEHRLKVSHPGRSFFFFIYLEGEDCMPCKLEKVAMLNNFTSDFEKFKTGVILVIQDDGKDAIKREYILETLDNMRITYPVVFDETDDFAKKNRLLSSKRCREFIVDKDNKVIWIGSPIQSDKSLDRFKKMMNLLNSSS